MGWVAPSGGAPVHTATLLGSDAGRSSVRRRADLYDDVSMKIFSCLPLSPFDWSTVQQRGWDGWWHINRLSPDTCAPSRFWFDNYLRKIPRIRSSCSENHVFEVKSVEGSSEPTHIRPSLPPGRFNIGIWSEDPAKLKRSSTCCVAYCFWPTKWLSISDGFMSRRCWGHTHVGDYLGRYKCIRISWVICISSNYQAKQTTEQTQ